MAISHTLNERPLQQLCTTVQLLDKIYFISVVLTIVTSHPGYLAARRLDPEYSALIFLAGEDTDVSRMKFPNNMAAAMFTL